MAFFNVGAARRKNRHYTGHRHYSTSCLSNDGTGNTEGLRFLSNAGIGITEESLDMYSVSRCTHSQGNNTTETECCIGRLAKHCAAEREEPRVLLRRDECMRL